MLGWLLMVAGVLLLVGMYFLWNDWGDAIERRIGKEQKIKSSDLGKTWGWRFLCLDGVLLILLGLTQRFWRKSIRKRTMGSIGVAGKVGVKDRLPRLSGAFLLGLVVISLVGSAVRVPRLGLSLYNDEAYGFRRYVAGSFRDDSSFRQAPWAETLWMNEMGNNGSIYSASARVCYDAWRSVSGAVDGVVKEWPLRLPSLLGGALSIFMAGLLVKEWSRSSVAGWVCGFLLAIHPWHLRYATEARPHGLAMGWWVLGIWLLWRALSSGGWRWWLGFAVCEVLLMGTYIGVLPFLMVLNVAVLAWIVIAANEREVLFFRWLVANMVAAMIWLPLFYPLIPQIMEAVERFSSMGGGPKKGWWWEVMALAGSGSYAWNSAPINPNNPALLGENLVWVRQLMSWGAVICSGVGFILGLSWLRKENNLGLVLGLASVVFGCLLAWVLSEVRNTVLHPWYAVVVLPVFVGVVSIGVSMTKKMKWFLLVPLVVGFLSVYQMYYLNGKEKIREVMEKIEELEAGKGNEREVICFWSDTPLYDKEVTPVWTTEELEQKLASTKNDAGKTLYATFSHREVALQQSPGLIERVEDSGDFEKIEMFPGLSENQYTNYLYRLVTE